MKSSRPALVALGALLLAAVVPVSAQEVKGRVVVLGFDGADHRLVTQFLAEGKLPNLAKLAKEGSFSPLRPTIPAQTPVSWSTFSTGLSPGRTQIFDFLKRDPKTYRPEFAIATEGKKAFLLGRGNRAGAAAAGALLAFLLVFALGRLTLKKTVPAAVSRSSSPRPPASSPGASADSSPSRSRPSTTTGRGRRSGRWPGRRGSSRSSFTSRSPSRPSTTTRGASSRVWAFPT